MNSNKSWINNSSLFQFPAFPLQESRLSKKEFFIAEIHHLIEPGHPIGLDTHALAIYIHSKAFKRINGMIIAKVQNYNFSH
jgi:hypothetical protein